VIKKFRRDESGITLIELLIAIVVVAILSATATSVFIHQRRKGWMAQVVAATKNLASVQEYVVNTAGVSGYATDLDTLRANGYTFSSGDVAPAVVATGSEGFCLEVSSRHDPAIVWHYNSSVGRPQEGAATPDCVAGLTLVAVAGEEDDDSGEPNPNVTVVPPDVAGDSDGEDDDGGDGSDGDGSGDDSGGGGSDGSDGSDGGDGSDGPDGGDGDGSDGSGSGDEDGSDGSDGSDGGDGTDGSDGGDGTDGSDGGDGTDGDGTSCTDPPDDDTKANPADPDGDENGGEDRPGGNGGVDCDKDNNNGGGNDTDGEDDNNGDGGANNTGDDGDGSVVYPVPW
jgi:prepilin-type N-terminal cleavage/methylation domain-containing protein